MKTETKSLAKPESLTTALKVISLVTNGAILVRRARGSD